MNASSLPWSMSIVPSSVKSQSNSRWFPHTQALRPVASTSVRLCWPSKAAFVNPHFARRYKGAAATRRDRSHRAITEASRTQDSATPRDGAGDWLSSRHARRRLTGTAQRPLGASWRTIAFEPCCRTAASAPCTSSSFSSSPTRDHMLPEGNEIGQVVFWQVRIAIAR